MDNAVVLARSDLFGGIVSTALPRLAALGRERRVPASQEIFRLGSTADSVFLIGEGEVVLTFPIVVLGEDKEVRFESLGAGRALAWSALVAPHRLTMSARAATDVRLVGFDRGALLELFREEPSLGLAVMSNLARVVGTRLQEIQALWVREVQRNVSETYR